VRLVLDLAGTLNFGAILIGLMWRRRRRQRRLSNLEHVRQLERENAEIDEANERMGATDSGRLRS
jgi:hypothetical protein